MYIKYKPFNTELYETNMLKYPLLQNIEINILTCCSVWLFNNIKKNTHEIQKN